MEVGIRDRGCSNKPQQIKVQTLATQFATPSNNNDKRLCCLRSQNLENRQTLSKNQNNFCRFIVSLREIIIYRPSLSTCIMHRSLWSALNSYWCTIFQIRRQDIVYWTRRSQRTCSVLKDKLLAARWVSPVNQRNQCIQSILYLAAAIAASSTGNKSTDARLAVPLLSQTNGKRKASHLHVKNTNIHCSNGILMHKRTIARHCNSQIERQTFVVSFPLYYASVSTKWHKFKITVDEKNFVFSSASARATTTVNHVSWSLHQTKASKLDRIKLNTMPLQQVRSKNFLKLFCEWQIIKCMTYVREIQSPIFTAINQLL